MKINLMKNVICLLLCITHVWLNANIACMPSGVSYQAIIRDNPAQKIHLVRIDPKRAAIMVDPAEGKCIGAETTTEIAQRSGAVVAMNGSYFDFVASSRFAKLCIKALDAIGYRNYKMVPVYALKIGDSWFSLSSLFTGIVGWDKEGKATLFDVGKTSIACTIGGASYPIKELNKPHMDAPTIYLPVYDTATPKTMRKSVEVVVVDGVVQKVISKSHGQTAIPRNGFVYAYPRHLHLLHDASLLQGESASVNVSYHSRDKDTTFAERWNSMDYVVAGTPLLIQDGNIISTLSERTSPFYTKRYPRTAIGMLEDGTLILIVIEGRQRSSSGFTIMELAQYMQQLGCVHALNLDGGGSSAMVINGTMVSAPAGHEWSVVKKERPISHALLVMPRRAAGFE